MNIRRIITGLLSVIFCLGAFAQQPEQKKWPVMTLEHTSHDFQTIAEGDGVVSHTFTFTNSGESALVINKAETACSCTKVEFSKKPVAVGAKSTLKVTYNPKKQSGTFHKVIRIYNNTKDKYQIITIKGEVSQK